MIDGGHEHAEHYHSWSCDDHYNGGGQWSYDDLVWLSQLVMWWWWNMVWSGKYLTEMTRGRQCSLTHGTNQNTIDGHHDHDDDEEEEQEDDDDGDSDNGIMTATQRGTNLWSWTSGTVLALWAASHSVKVRVATKRCSVKGFFNYSNVCWYINVYVARKWCSVKCFIFILILFFS